MTQKEQVADIKKNDLRKGKKPVESEELRSMIELYAPYLLKKRVA